MPHPSFSALSWTVGDVMNHVRKYISWALFLVMAASLWWWVLPPALGGRTTFFVTKGISMAPYLETNDLAVLHKSRQYKVGDVVAYHSKSLNAIILHRVIEVSAEGQLTTKGDANELVDNDHPRPGEVIGRLDHKINGAGTKYMWIKSTPARIVGSLLIAWAVYGALMNRDQRKRQHEQEEGNSQTEQPTSGTTEDGPPGVEPPERGGFKLPSFAGAYGKTTPIFAAVLVVSALLFIASFLVPSSSSRAHEVVYTMKGQLSYNAVPRQGGDLVYQQGKAVTGDPLYVALIDAVGLDYVFDLSTAADFEGGGTYSLDAVLTSPSGWVHTINLVPTTEFTGTSFDNQSQIKVSDIRSITDQIQKLTTITDSRITLNLSPHVKLQGTLDGAKVDDSFDSKLEFNIEKQRWSPAGAGKTDSSTLPTAEKLETSSPSLLGLDKKKGNVIATPSISDRISGNDEGPLASTLKSLGILGIIVGLAGLIVPFRSVRRRVEEQVDIHAEAINRFETLITQPTSAKFAVAGAPVAFDAPMTSTADGPLKVEDIEDGYDDLERKLDELDALLPKNDAIDPQVEAESTHQMPSAEARFRVQPTDDSSPETATSETEA